MAKGQPLVNLNSLGFDRKMQRAMKNLDPDALLEAIGMSAMNWVNENFETQGGHVGGWDDIQESTKKRKGHGSILIHHGILRASIEAEKTAPNKLRVGTNVEYAAHHQFGTSTIPQRRFLPNEEEGKKLAVSLIRAAIAKIERESGGDDEQQG